MQTTTEKSKKRPRKVSFVSAMLVLALVLMFAAVSIPNLLRSRIAANEASAVGSVRTINTALATYAAEHPGQGYPEKLSELSPYIDPVLAGGQKSGYQFRYEPEFRNASGAVTSFKVEAKPMSAQMGTRRFSSDEGGQISFRTGAASPEQSLDGGAPAPVGNPAPEIRRTIETASLTLIASDPGAVAEKIRAVAFHLGGYVDSMRVSGDGAGKQVSIAIRVPSVRLGEARLQVRGLADHVANEQDDARDVTGNFVDLESNLRNFRVEEAQYREIMRRSGSIKDTLAVAERLADVRGRIERVQGQMNLLSHQTEMALLQVSVSAEVVPQPVDVRWHPIAEVKAAFSAAAGDLTDYADFMIAVLFRLPVFILWAATLLGSALAVWRVLRWIWSKRLPAPAV